VPVQPIAGVTAALLDDGQLELVQSTTGARWRCDTVGTAMWIALRQHGGDVETAARTLAGALESDPTNIKADLDIWVDELCDAGLVGAVP
jgi:Coenzyme PQQ synthesis protein D (PqqD)